MTDPKLWLMFTKECSLVGCKSSSRLQIGRFSSVYSARLDILRCLLARQTLDKVYFNIVAFSAVS